MYKKKRNDIDKLKTLFFGKDLRVSEGEPYKEVRNTIFQAIILRKNILESRVNRGKML